MLAGVLQGWAAPEILDAYEAERWPITEQVSHYAMNTALSLARARAEVPAEIESAGPEGDAARERFGKMVYELNVPQYCCGGLNFGYFYEHSPIICYDGEGAPSYSMYDFTPSTVPGCRVPHVWLNEGRLLYDAISPGFTLLRFDRSLAVDPLVQAAAKRNLPLGMLDIDEAPPFRHKLVVPEKLLGHWETRDSGVDSNIVNCRKTRFGVAISGDLRCVPEDQRARVRTIFSAPG